MERTTSTPHDYPDGFVKESYLPEALQDTRFYRPKSVGFEEELRKRLARYLERQKTTDTNGSSADSTD